MSLEYQRYGRNKETVINHAYINSGDYRSKFNQINGYTEFEAQWKTLEKLKENHDIDFWEVLP